MEQVTEFDVDNIGPHDLELYADYLRDTLIAAYRPRTKYSIWNTCKWAL